jgi:hypothetical protein
VLLNTLSGVLEPTRVVKSGGGLHVKWELKEPVEPDDPTVARAWSYLISLLGADPSISHAAALLREEGTHNSKRGDPVLVEAVWGSGNPVDITEFENLSDKLGDRPLLTKKAKAAESASNGSMEPFDAEKSLSEMEAGVDVHRTQVRSMSSLIARGMSLHEATNAVMEETKAAATRAGKENEWSWDKEHYDVCRQGVDWINKHPEYADRLPDPVRKTFQDKLAAGEGPRLYFDRRTGLHVREYIVLR